MIPRDTWVTAQTGATANRADFARSLLEAPGLEFGVQVSGTPSASTPISVVLPIRAVKLELSSLARADVRITQKRAPDLTRSVPRGVFVVTKVAEQLAVRRIDE